MAVLYLCAELGQHGTFLERPATGKQFGQSAVVVTFSGRGLMPTSLSAEGVEGVERFSVSSN